MRRYTMRTKYIKCFHLFVYINLSFLLSLFLTGCYTSLLISSQQGGRSRSRTAGQDVSQAEVPPAKEEVVQQVSDILA